MTKRYTVFSYGPPDGGRSDQRTVGRYADRGEADRAAYDAVIGGRHSGQVLADDKGLVFFVDGDEIAAGLRLA